MSLSAIDRFENFEDVKKMYLQILNNLSYDDIGVGQLKTNAPTTDTLGKGKSRLVEESGVPALYYRAINGSIYKFTPTLVS